jgi:hypothetical protein
MAKDIFDEIEVADLSHMISAPTSADQQPSILVMSCSVGEFSFRVRMDQISAYWGEKTHPCQLCIQVGSLTHKSMFQNQTDRDSALKKLDAMMLSSGSIQEEVKPVNFIVRMILKMIKRRVF